MKKQNWTCAYDGTEKKLADGRCAACGRSSAKEAKRDADKWDAESSSTKHAPMPWHYAYEGSGSNSVYGPNDDCICICEAGIGKSRDEQEANARFIVCAVNNFDDMLNALKQVQIIIDAQGGADRLGIAIAKVIAKAEGK